MRGTALAICEGMLPTTPNMPLLRQNHDFEALPMHADTTLSLANCRFLKAFLYMAIFCQYIASNAFAAQWQDHADLQNAAREFVQQSFDEEYELEITVGNLDNRLLLEECQGPLHTFLPYHKPPLGAVSVGVRCEMPDWKVHVSLQVRAYTNVMVAKQPLTRGTMISENDIESKKREISRYSAGVYTEQNQLIGMITKRNIRQDAVMTPRMVEPRRLVSRGQDVTIIAEFNGMQIRTKGEALMDGHKGQVISVENTRSGKKISGEVIAPSTVRVKM